MASTQGGRSLLKGANSPRPAGRCFVLLVTAGRAEREKQSRATLVLSTLSGVRQGDSEQNPPKGPNFPESQRACSHGTRARREATSAKLQGAGNGVCSHYNIDIFHQNTQSDRATPNFPCNMLQTSQEPKGSLQLCPFLPSRS